MKQYIRIYKTLLKINLVALLTYRGNFVSSVFSSILWASFSLFIISLLTLRVPKIYGWNREELFMLMLGYNIIVGTFHSLFSRNFERFSQIIHYGELDGLLLKPVDSQFLLSFWLFNYASLSRIIIGIIGFVILFSQHQIFPSLLQFFLFFMLGIISILLLYSIWYSVTTLMIWFTRLSNLVDFLYHMNGATRFPQEMYKGSNQLIFFLVFPLTLVITTPIKALLEKATIADVYIILICATLLFSFSRLFWKFALRFYTSASG